VFATLTESIFEL